MDLTRSKVTIDPIVLSDILLAVALTPIEISGYGRIVRNGNILSIVPELAIFEQQGSMGGTEFSGELESLNQASVSSWQKEMMLSGQGELINQYRLWWHSHVYHPAVFSSTDDAMMELLAEETSDAWWLRLVANKYGRVSVSIDQFKPYRETIKNVELRSSHPITKRSLETLMHERHERMQRIIEEKVTVLDHDPIEMILSEFPDERD
ncbi:MAG: hypothetical protein Q7S28_03820 [bacterium]|nr:hypothetical protein [bacterium]